MHHSLVKDTIIECHNVMVYSHKRTDTVRMEDGHQGHWEDGHQQEDEHLQGGWTTVVRLDTGREDRHREDRYQTDTGRTPDGWTPDGRTLDGRTPDGRTLCGVWGCVRTDTGPTLCGCGGVFYVRLGSVCCVICLPSVCPVSFISPSCVRLHFRNFGYGRTYGRTDVRTDTKKKSNVNISLSFT